MTTEVLAVRDGTSLARNAADHALRFVVPLDELRLQLAQLEEFKRDIMVADVDYGVIPGTNKPTLLKPGAEKLSLAFGLAPLFTVTNKIEDWERGFFHYEVTCELYSKRTGERVANGIGSANSKESRYRWRDAKPTCPDCGSDLRRSKRREGEPGEPDWYCWSRMGGCGATWPKDTVKAVGRVENPEPYELVNTLMKMAEKRSLVAAVLIATGGSGIWTQDLEDMPSGTGDGSYSPTREREVVDVPPRQAAQQNGNGNGQPAPQPPRNARQAAAQATLKPTTTRCSVCERMVESESLLRDSQKRFTVPFCSQHFNEALDQAKGTEEREQETPL